VVVAALGGQAGLDLAALLDQAGPQALLAGGLGGELGGERLDLAAQRLDLVHGGPVRPHHLLLVLGGDQGLVDAVGAQQLAQGRGRPTGVDGPQPPAEQAAGGAQAGDLVGRGLAGGGVGHRPLDADAAEGDAEQHERDQNTGQVSGVEAVRSRRGRRKRWPCADGSSLHAAPDA
jgi:hypothetical protein